MRSSSSAGCTLLVAVSDLASLRAYGASQGYMLMWKGTALRSESGKGCEAKMLVDGLRRWRRGGKRSHKVKKTIVAYTASRLRMWRRKKKTWEKKKRKETPQLFPSFGQEKFLGLGQEEFFGHVTEMSGESGVREKWKALGDIPREVLLSQGIW